MEFARYVANSLYVLAMAMCKYYDRIFERE